METNYQTYVLDHDFPHNLHAIRQCREFLMSESAVSDDYRGYYTTLLRSFLHLVPVLPRMIQPAIDANCLLQLIEREIDTDIRSNYITTLLGDMLGDLDAVLEEQADIEVVARMHESIDSSAATDGDRYDETDSEDSSALAFSQGLELRASEDESS